MVIHWSTNDYSYHNLHADDLNVIEIETKWFPNNNKKRVNADVDQIEKKSVAISLLSTSGNEQHFWLRFWKRRKNRNPREKFELSVWNVMEEVHFALNSVNRNDKQKL